jgi:predicted RNase H-like HicB family nuclease
MRHLYVIENGSRNYAGYFPDMPGCVARAKSVDKLPALAREALDSHVEDEKGLHRSRRLKSHLAEGLKLAASDMIARVEFEPYETLASVLRHKRTC